MRTLLVLAMGLLLAVLAVVVLKDLAVQEPRLLDRIPAIGPETAQALQTQSRRVGMLLSWGVIAFSVLLQLAVLLVARRRLNAIKALSGVPAGLRLRLLENADIYFDLPLYFGLLGTVLSFILITVFPEAGLMFAYSSTGVGIVVSVFLRLRLLTPYRQSLLEQSESERRTAA